MITQIAYASCYVYSPAGLGQVCERSRLLRTLLKEGDAHFMGKYVGRVRQQAQESAQLAGFFPADLLVPVPGCGPARNGHTWVAADLATALVNFGLGEVVWTGLHRARAVRKSATACVGERPSVATHYRSLRIEHPPFTPHSVLLVDDIITRGRTLLAAAARVREVFPNAQVRAFALVRTMGLVGGVTRLLEPCQGEIKWEFGDAQRTP